MSVQMTECERLLAAADDSQKIGAFLDWLGDEQDIHLCSPHTHGESCYRYGNVEPKEGDYKSWDYMGQAKYIGEKELDCLYRNGEMVHIRESFEKLLARYFNIDMGKVEKERRAILEELRGVNNGSKR